MVFLRKKRTCRQREDRSLIPMIEGIKASECFIKHKPWPLRFVQLSNQIYFLYPLSSNMTKTGSFFHLSNFYSFSLTGVK